MNYDLTRFTFLADPYGLATRTCMLEWEDMGTLVIIAFVFN